jgi:hypothetical protein
LALQQQQLAEQKRQYDLKYQLEKEQLAAQKASISKSSNSGSSSSGAKKSGGATVNKSSTKSSGSQYGNIDGDSVLALGYGPISASRLAQLVESGEVNLVNTGGKIVAVRAKAKGTTTAAKYGLK